MLLQFLGGYVSLLDTGSFGLYSYFVCVFFFLDF